MSKIALIDFKDSFSYNIYHYLVSNCDEVKVFEDGAFELDELADFDKIVLSPGPGLPSETKSLFAVLERYHQTKTIWGICLGMQGIVEFFGGKIYNQEKVKHGVAVAIDLIDDGSLFTNLPQRFAVGLYHSWACDVSESTALKMIARSDEMVLMAVQHRKLPIYGVQFHPESILTEFGKEIVTNFVYL
ncbi:MAG: aminodeoxychorismate/anthranilate synthase component II [Bacteroidota bacterium]